MKKSLFFVMFILMLLIFQDIHSEGNRTFFKGVDHSTRRFVLWRVYTQHPDSDGNIFVTVDSVLKTDSVYKDFYIKEKFLVSGKKESLNKLRPNNYYLMLTMAACNDDKENFRLFFPEENHILPDTQENREFLSKKWSETKVIYTNPNQITGGAGHFDAREFRIRKKN